MGDHGVFLLLLLLHNCNLEELSFCRSHSFFFFFCVLCFVLHARACLTLELPVHLLFVTSCCRRVRRLYFQCTRMYINPPISRAILWTQSNIRTGSEAHTMCTRVSRGNGKKKKRNSIMFVHGLHTYCIAGHVEKENMKRWAKREERKKKK